MAKATAQGWRVAGPAPIFGAMRSYLARFNLFRAFRDARTFFAARRGYEIRFMLASLAACIGIVAAFVADSNVKAPWKRPEIIWVQSWRADRTDADILAQQKIDEAKKKQHDAAQKKLDDENKAAFKRLNDKVSPWL
jgi:hypothetical protein